MGFSLGEILFCFILVFVFLDKTSVWASLANCPKNTKQITSPCKFSPGNHSYEILTIASDIYLETDQQSCEHFFNVSQGLIVQSSATIYVGFCEKVSGIGIGVSSANSGGSGGSHGGRGGSASLQVLTANQAQAYGSTFKVSSHGSKGGGSGGGKGGGSLQIVAKAFTLNGVIRATGENGLNNGGGGSGGGFSATADQIDGLGRIEVNGGLGDGAGGGGGGGRTSIVSKYGLFKGKALAFGGKPGKWKIFIVLIYNVLIRCKFLS